MIEDDCDGEFRYMRLPPEVCARTLVAQTFDAELNPRALSAFALQPRAGANRLVIGHGSAAAEELAPPIRALAELAAVPKASCRV